MIVLRKARRWNNQEHGNVKLGGVERGRAGVESVGPEEETKGCKEDARDCS